MDGTAFPYDIQTCVHYYRPYDYYYNRMSLVAVCGFDGMGVSEVSGLSAYCEVREES
jgi:hypothetical protein